MFITVKSKWFNQLDFSTEPVDSLCLCMDLYSEDLKSMDIS